MSAKKMTRLDLHNEMMKAKMKDKRETAITYVLKTLDLKPHCSDDYKRQIVTFLRDTFFNGYFRKLTKSKRNYKTFEVKNCAWLNTEIIIPLENTVKAYDIEKDPVFAGKVAKIGKVSRELKGILGGWPTLPLNKSTVIKERKKIQKMKDVHSVEESVSATATSNDEDCTSAALPEEGKSDITENKGTKAKQMLQRLETTERELSKLSPEETLTFIHVNKLSKQVYLNIRNISLLHGHDEYPSFQEILEAKKKRRESNDLSERQKLIDSTLDDLGYMEEMESPINLIEGDFEYLTD